jgi:hypothetical protein
MPFPRTWVEELIAEWLHLEGFLVEANLPVSVASAGGRGEADVVGAKISNGQLQILHIETGQLSGGEKSISSVEKKFGSVVRESVKGYFKERFSYTGESINYKVMYIATFWTKPTVSGLERLGVEVLSLPRFIRKKVLPTIKRWKQNPPHSPRCPGHLITLPESHWLLILLDYLSAKGLIRIDE